MAKVYVSSFLNAPAAQVWKKVRDFNGMPDWHPAIESSRIENNQPSDQVGCIRAFSFKDVGFIRERLLALSDYDYRFCYEIVESTMPIEHYVATLHLIPVTDGNATFGEWSASFDCNAKDESAIVDQIAQNVFQAGFDELKRGL